MDNPEDTREVREVELDLAVEEDAATAPNFAHAIEAASMGGDPATSRQAQARLHARIREATAAFEAETGLRASPTLRVYKPQAKAVYELWKRVGQAFIHRPDTLDMKPVALAAMLNNGVCEYAVTPRMLHAKLSGPAERGLRGLLADAGMALTLARPVSLRSVQKQMAAERDARTQRPVEEFVARISIDGDTCRINGVVRAIQRDPAGRPRIRHGGRWLPLDVLREVSVVGP